MPSRNIDLDSIRRLVAAAGDLPVTYHRAFDFCLDPALAITQLIDLGVKRVLTSGGAATAHEGRHQIAKVVRQAAAALTVIAGGGISSENVIEVVNATGVQEIHLSGVRQIDSELPDGFGMNTAPNPARLSSVLEALNCEWGQDRSPVSTRGR